MMEPLIRNAAEIVSFFSKYNTLSHIAKKEYDRGLLVTTEIRKEFLVSTNQGKIVCDGKVVEVKFKNMGGGVWLARVEQ